MCYELRFFRSWTKHRAQQREEITPEDVRAVRNVQPIRPVPEPQVTRRKHVERELEEIV